MRAATQCYYQGEAIEVAQALEIRDASESRPFFTCIVCKEPVRPHRAGGEHSAAHFEHYEVNQNCPHSAGERFAQEILNIDDPKAVEGYMQDRSLLVGVRNQALAKECKARDNYKCVACGFRLKHNGRYVIECHHQNPIGSGGQRVTELQDLVSLCPTCHRVAHTRKEPLSVKEIREVLGL